MNRRELLKLIAATTGTAMIGGSGLLTGCATSSTQTALTFSPDDIVLLDEIAETILPRTQTPGAKDAKVGQFMTVYVNDCYTREEQATFHKGLLLLEERCHKTYGHGFMALQPAEREEFVSHLDKHAKAEIAAGKMHYFTMIKQLTLFGFFTSEVGGTQVLRHVAIPGRFDGELPYKPGDRAWATR
ncbi:gluconate 2-dehydrogenase subunit 3 family protein [Cellvibrio mixtus]|uniref:gluconate 2-dehydrogenase subunit 3 family protein n=1 Tax=Cellvibrio mixtus TaxID=39650 RepID=UPI000587E54B|nr:gluconate 2-dehydrogenase subunit 3 family protein [Cellvibrio mixtus]